MTSYDNFAETFSKSRDGMKWPEIDYLIEVARKETGLLKNPSILDIGCGSGRLLDSLEKTFDTFEYLGIDSSEKMIEEAKKRHKVRDFEISAMEDFKGDRSPKFDLVFLIASFHHLDTKEKRLDVLRSIYSSIKPGGMVLMSNWNLNSPENLKRYSDFKVSENDFLISLGGYKRFYHSFTCEELNELIEIIGFSSIKCELSQSARNFITYATK